ncbi:unnamed protein product, partial [Protopolystoma xenopodis]
MEFLPVFYLPQFLQNCSQRSPFSGQIKRLFLWNGEEVKNPREACPKLAGQKADLGLRIASEDDSDVKAGPGLALTFPFGFVIAEKCMMHLESISAIWMTDGKEYSMRGLYIGRFFPLLETLLKSGRPDDVTPEGSRTSETDVSEASSSVAITVQRRKMHSSARRRQLYGPVWLTRGEEVNFAGPLAFLARLSRTMHRQITSQQSRPAKLVSPALLGNP